MSKLRVWWVPNLNKKDKPVFYIPVNSPEEGITFMDILSSYDAFQHVNAGGLEVWDEENKVWKDWYSEDDELDIYEYGGECSKADELEEFARKLWKQIDRSKLE